MWCPSCHEQYDEVITQQQNVAFGYEHVTSFIARHLDRIPFVRRVEKRVALHYHTGHVQADRDWQHTRAILQAIPGLDLVHIDNPAALGRHCTPRWIGRVGRPTWQRTITDILDAAKGAGCDTVASIYHSCHREICVQEASSPISIVNYISLLGEAMGIEHPDIYKRFRLQADPQAAFQEVEPYVQAHGLNTDRVRKTLGEAFGSNVDVDTSNPS